MPIKRNPVARAPIMRKGGVHQRARSGIRQQARQQLNNWLQDELEEYLEQRQQQNKDRQDKDVLPYPIALAI